MSVVSSYGALMHLATFNESGAVEIPEEIRAALDLQPQEELIVEMRGRSVVLRPRDATPDGASSGAFGCLSQYAIAYASREERDAAERAGIEEAVRENNPMPGEPGYEERYR